MNKRGQRPLKVSPKPGTSAASLDTFPRWLSQPAVICCLLVAATLAVYWPVGQFDFACYDDSAYAAENPHVQAGLTWPGVTWAFCTGSSANWHPLTWLSLMLDCQFHSQSAGIHHSVNVMFHVANTILLFLLLRGMTGASWRSAFVAALFALHPLHVESVAWIAERKDVLSTLFGLLALHAYVGYAGGSKQQGAHPKIDLGLALGWFACSLMSKPMLVTLPFVMFLLDFWPLRRLELRNTPDKRRVALGLILEKIPFLVLSAAACTVTFFVQQKGGAVDSLVEFPVTARIENVFVSYAQYLGKMFWPVKLAVFYPHPVWWPTDIVVGSILLILLLSVAVIWLGRGRPYLMVGWFWFLGTLVPVIGLVQVGLQALADRYTYLPSVGIFIIVAWGTTEIWLRWRWPQWLAGLAGVLVILTCAWRTTDQLGYWRNAETLFRHAIAVTANNSLAYSNLGHYLEDRGQTGQAIEYYKKAIQIDPRNLEALNNLGSALIDNQQYDEGITCLEFGLRLNPDYTEALNNLATALIETRRYSEAVDYLKKALQQRPNYPNALNNLGNAYVRLGQVEEGIACYHRALEIEPDYAEARNDLGNAMIRLGHTDEAIQQFNETLHLNPHHAEAHNNLGDAYARLGRMDDAMLQYRAALQIRPNYPDALNNLGFALASQKEYDQAVASYEAALRLKPDLAAAHVNLADVLAMNGRFDAAAAHLMKAVQLEPDNPRAQFNLGSALIQLGQKDEAIAHLQKVLQLKPGFAPAIEQLRTLGVPVNGPDKP